MIEYLSGEFNRGYTKAIMDMIKIFDYIDSDLKYRKKRMNGKIAKDLLNCCLENRERLRESVNGFIRCTGGKDNFTGFEFYEPGEKR